jgi:hypothetical protein
VLPRSKVSGKPFASQNDVYGANEQGLSLDNMKDFDTRKNVANLMAIAPALPDRDPCGFIIDLDEDLGTARKHAIKASRAPSARPSINPETPSTGDHLRHIARPSEDSCEDEFMFNIDPNDDFFEWVSRGQTMRRKAGWELTLYSNL